MMKDDDITQRVQVMTLGRYQLLRKVGRGGMGEVWLAEDPRLHRQVAIKTLPSHNRGDNEFLQRFEREARAAAALNHPHILPIHDYGEQTLPDGQGVTYIVMPYIPGGTLADRLKAITAEKKLLPAHEAINYLRQAAEAIDYAHSVGVVHRDIKPANMLLRSENWLLLADFGIARMLANQESLTQAGMGIGTPEYMAPEQAQGKPEPASDNYSLAVIAYHLFTGQLPFQAETPYATSIQHITAPPPSPRQLNPDLAPAVERALLHGLAKDPARRPPSALAFVNELQNALSDTSFDAIMLAPTGALTLPSGIGSKLPDTEQPVAPTVIDPASSTTVAASATPTAPASIKRRQVLIGGGVLLAAAAGLGSWAFLSQQRSSTAPAPGTTSHKPAPDSNAPLLTLNGHTQPISSVVWSPTTPNLLASAGKDAQVALWDIAAIQQGQASLTSPKAKQQLNASTTSNMLLAWSPDGQGLAVANGTFALDAQNPNVIDQKMHIYKSDLSGLVPYYDDQLMTFLRTAIIFGVAWQPQNQIMALTFPYELVGKAQYYIEFRNPTQPHQGIGRMIQFGYSYGLRISPDGSTVAIANYNGVLIGQIAFNGKTPAWKKQPTTLAFDSKKPLTFDGSPPPTGGVTWSPDSKYVAAITNAQFVPKYLVSQLAVWDVQAGSSSRIPLSLPTADTILTTVAWSPAASSTQLAAGSKDGSVYLWNVNTNSNTSTGNALPIRSLTGIKGAAVTSLSWSADGRWLAAGYNDTKDSILLWKLQ